MNHETVSAPDVRLRRAIAWPLLLAAICVTVLGTRVYVDFERVRVRVVTSSRPADGSSLIVPLRNQQELAGLPVAIILRIQGAA